MGNCIRITLLSSAWFGRWKSSRLIFFYRNVNGEKRERHPHHHQCLKANAGERLKKERLVQSFGCHV